MNRPGFPGARISWKGKGYGETKQVRTGGAGATPEVRERAVRMVLDGQSRHESQGAAIRSIAEKFGCSPETLRGWVRRSERDSGVRPGLTSGSG